MAITTSVEYGGKKLRRGNWEFQRTFRTPLKDLRRFTRTVLADVEELSGAVVHIEELVFEPKALNVLLARNRGKASVVAGMAIGADGAEDAGALLSACLACWMDFFFVPTPKPFIVYADHDEYTTVLATRKAGLNAACGPLVAAGFEVVDYERRF